MTASLASTIVPSPSARPPLAVPQPVARVPLIEVGVGKATGEVVVRLVGEAGVRRADELTAALLGLSALRPPLVTLDLSGLHAISCLTMGVLVTFRRGIIRAGGRVRLAAALQQPVRAALEGAGLFALFGMPGGA